MRTLRPDTGLTLIEMLVVLAIIGIASSATVLSLRSGPRSISAQAEANRLRTTLQAAGDAAVLGGSAQAFTADARGYMVVGWDPVRGRWLEAGARHELADGLELRGVPVAPVPFARDATGATIDLTLSGRGSSWRIGFDGLTAAALPE